MAKALRAASWAEQPREKECRRLSCAARGQWQSHVKTVQAPLLKKYSAKAERIVRVSRKGKHQKRALAAEERYAFAYAGAL